MSPLGNEGARAQVGTNGGLSQRWRSTERAFNTAYAELLKSQGIESANIHVAANNLKLCADELDAAKLRIEEALKALYGQFTANGPRVSRDAVLKIIREIL